MIAEIDNGILKKIKSLADDKDWENRETAAGMIKCLNDGHFTAYLTVWQQWVHDPNPNVRRAVEVGLLRIPKKHYREAFELLLPLLTDDNPYVRKNCGPFALSAVAFRNPPDAFMRMEELIRSKDKNVRWNIAMCLGVMFGLKFPEQSLHLLKELAKDERRFVWRAVASSLVKLLRRYPSYKEEVFAWKGVENVLAVVHRYIGE